MHDMISNKTLRWEYSRHHEGLDRPGQDIYICQRGYQLKVLLPLCIYIIVVNQLILRLLFVFNMKRIENVFHLIMLLLLTSLFELLSTAKISESEAKAEALTSQVVRSDSGSLAWPAGVISSSAIA